jgi:hypothetical protein
MHHGPYSASNHGDNPTAKSKVVPILKKYNVDMTFAGHDHNYERGEADGLRYIVAGGGGAPLYSSGTSKYTIYSESVLHYVVINVFGADVSGCAYRVDGSVMDCFSWSKGRPLEDAGSGDITESDTDYVDSQDAYGDLSSGDGGVVESEDNILYLDKGFEDESSEDNRIIDAESSDVLYDTRDILSRDTGSSDRDTSIIDDISISKPDTPQNSSSDSSGCSCLVLD